jgi:biopolymer transport protein ExbB/TolQ
MIDTLVTIKEAWDAGGVFIYPIHVVGILTIAITIERVYWLYVKSSMNVEAFLNQIGPVLQRKDLQGAIQFCDSISAPSARVAKRLIVRALSRGSRSDIEATIESSLAKEGNPIERRTSYLSMLANVATLLGLLGTISGLIISFGGAASADAEQKAEMLAMGISEAMNCTAYGLIIAIFALFAFALLQGKSQTLIDEMKETAFEIRGLLPMKEEEAA